MKDLTNLSAGDYAVRMAEQMIIDMDDKSIQKMLDEIYNGDLEIMMKVMDERAKQRILDNLSPKVAELIMLSSDYNDEANPKDVRTAGRNVFTLIAGLITSDDAYFNGFLLQ